jgi:flagellar biosynthesis protein FlhF
VFIGPPGSGKSTALCKWLTLAVLTEERNARVCRLDGATANTAEFLAVHCEMLGVPIERFWSKPDARSDLLFVDLPGVELNDDAGMAVLQARLKSLPSPRVHLVLNAAYETAALMAQWRAFAAFEPEDLVFTHMDEEQRRIKLWNLVFGTNCSPRFLSAGQKIPGEFLQAAPSLLFPSKISR